MWINLVKRAIVGGVPQASPPLLWPEFVTLFELLPVLQLTQLALLSDIIHEPSTPYRCEGSFIPGIQRFDSFALMRISIVLLIDMEVEGGFLGVVSLEHNDCCGGSR